MPAIELRFDPDPRDLAGARGASALAHKTNELSLAPDLEARSIPRSYDVVEPIALGAYRPNRSTHNRRPRNLRKRRSSIRFLLPAVGALVLVVGLLVVALAKPQFGGAKLDDTVQLLAGHMSQTLDRLAAKAGFPLSQVALTGHRNISDTKVFESLQLASARSLLAYDTVAARKRLVQLPWVADANIARVWPDQLAVRITERAPFAVWLAQPDMSGPAILYDETGQQLSEIIAVGDRSAKPHLLRLSGAGAGPLAAQAAALTRVWPDLAKQVDRYEWVGGRRWTLHLSGQRTIQLPQIAPVAALSVLQEQIELNDLRPGTKVDLRVNGRILLRRQTQSGRA